MADTKTQETYNDRNKTRVAIPEEVLARYNPEDGDELDITVKDGYIYIEPVAVYPKEAVGQWEKDIEEMEVLDAAGKLKHYTDIDEMFRDIKAGVPDAV